MTDTTPTPADRPADGLLGPITPIRCTELGCHWACHGVPDKYADSRARIVREHMAAEHAPTPEPGPAPVWVDGDPLMEATACAVWERCRTENSIVVDDPRNIAAVAATVARQLLGTSAVAAEPGCAMPGFMGCECDHVTGCQHPAAPPAPADRAAVLREAAVAVAADRDATSGARSGARQGMTRAVTLLRRRADDAAAGVQPSTSEAELTATLVINRTDSYCDGCRKPTLPQRTHHTDISGWTPVPGGGCGARFTATRSDYRDITPDELREVRPDLPPATPPAAPAAPEETQ